MTKTSLLIAGALVLSGISVANAKSFDIVLTRPSKAGNVVLRAGEYSVKLKGSNAVFTENETTDRFTAPVRSRTPRKTRLDSGRIDEPERD